MKRQGVPNYLDSLIKFLRANSLAFASLFFFFFFEIGALRAHLFRGARSQPASTYYKQYMLRRY